MRLYSYYPCKIQLLLLILNWYFSTAATSLTWPLDAVQTKALLILNPGFFSTWIVLDNADTHMVLTQGCPALLIDSTTRYYNSSVQRGRALERAFIVLNSMSMHYHTYWKYIGSLRSIALSPELAHSLLTVQMKQRNEAIWSRDTSSLRTLEMVVMVSAL